MVQKLDGPATMGITSETALDGFITFLYSVQNERTKEQFIIGGADDGSISFWSLKYVSSSCYFTMNYIPPVFLDM